MKPVDGLTIGIGLVAAALVFGSPALLLSAAVWIGLLVLCARAPLSVQAVEHELELDRTLVEVGESVQFRASSGAQQKFSLGWFRHEVTVNSSEGPIDSVASISFGSGVRRLGAVRRVSLESRGVYDVTLSTDAAVDVFGMRTAEPHGSKTVTVLAHPKTLELRVRPPRPRSGAGDRVALRHASRLGQQPAGAREYERGDSSRQIHWKLTAARGTLMTRVSEAAVEPRYWIFWDVSNGQPPTAREANARLAATMAEQWLSDRELLGLWVHGHLDPRVEVAAARKCECGYYLPPNKSIEAMSAIRIGLASAMGTDRSPELSIVELGRHAQRGDVVVFLGLPVNQKSVAVLEELSRRGATIAMVVHHRAAAEIQPLPPGVLVATCEKIEEARYLEFVPI